MEYDLTPYIEAKKAIKKSRAARVFIFHLVSFVIGNAFLGFWNFLTYFVKESATLWFFIPLLFWGVAVIVHYVYSVALFEEWWELDERTIGGRMRG